MTALIHETFRPTAAPQLDQPTVLVREQFDTEGDLVYEFKMSGLTHSRSALDHLASSLGCGLRFAPEIGLDEV